VAGTVGVLGLTFVAPPLADFSLRIGPAEYFSLTILGLMLATYLSGKSVIKGLIMAVLGLLLATVGMDPVTGNMRYTFGLLILEDGFDFLTLGMGLFGIGEGFLFLPWALRWAHGLLFSSPVASACLLSADSWERDDG
jgi:putative tricarboxylic transport membrane protein